METASDRGIQISLPQTPAPDRDLVSQYTSKAAAIDARSCRAGS
ncbi:hypothetical protein OG948_33390 [Embleya sp. NBC_00888]|nr:hypothetical protein OG948_33390 [Embleya sp. NBC_00888]